jgi:hypothetical protein
MSYFADACRNQTFSLDCRGASACEGLGSRAEAPRFAMPIAAKTVTMPTYHGLRPDDRDGLENRWKPAIQLDEQQPLAVRQLDSTVHLALRSHQLMAKRGILCFKSALGLEQRGTQVQNEEYQCDHRGRS